MTTVSYTINSLLGMFPGIVNSYLHGISTTVRSNNNLNIRGVIVEVPPFKQSSDKNIHKGLYMYK